MPRESTGHGALGFSIAIQRWPVQPASSSGGGQGGGVGLQAKQGARTAPRAASERPRRDQAKRDTRTSRLSGGGREVGVPSIGRGYAAGSRNWTDAREVFHNPRSRKLAHCPWG